MHRNLLTVAAMLALPMAAQTACKPVSGIVADDTGAVIPGATLTLDNVQRTADPSGHYTFPCVNPGTHTLHAQMPGFAPATSTIKMAASPLSVNVKLLVKGDDETIEVGQEGTGIDKEDFAGSKTIKQDDLAKLADDPDDFKRELQVLAAAGGGAPGAATISVDGFQNDAPLPPKGSIAFIRVNPDLFSSEYGDPPYEGGRIEIYTKPGGLKVHGALFLTNSPTFANARDPFSTSKAALGKQRYGMELSGGIIPQKWDYSLNLEHREINNFAVVNAYVPDNTGTAVQTIYNVPQGQHLWMASARSGYQISKQNLLTTSFNAYVQDLDNDGAGGNVLREAATNIHSGDYTIRTVLISTLSPRLVHEGRFSFQVHHENNVPNSTAPSVSVAGAFTCGGSSAGLYRHNQNQVEIFDDVIYTRGKHNLKIGINSLAFFNHDTVPTSFNGTYYYSSLAAYNTGTATTYSITSGTPTITLAQSRTALFVQDQVKLNQHFSIAAGLRYQFQNEPSSYTNIAPRFGVAWSPDKKGRLVLRARTGLFYNQLRTPIVEETLRLNGQRQTSALYYPSSSTPTTAIYALKQMAPGLSQGPTLQENFALEYSFPHGWNFQANTYPIVGWNLLRGRNINAPLNNQLGGPRPGPANTNILQYQNSARFHGHVEFYGLDQHSFRNWQAFIGYLHMDFSSNTGGRGSITIPQNTYSDAGEYARPEFQSSHRIFLFGSVTLPWKLTLSTNFDAESGQPFNITTGLDNNGDGNFNDRPTYSNAACNNAAGIYCTSFGTLSSNSLVGTPINRNLGTLPWTVHLDNNLARTFKLSKKADGQSITLNLRAANLLNHTNVSSVGSVLGSPYSNVPYTAETGRRIEAGLRYAF